MAPGETRQLDQRREWGLGWWDEGIDSAASSACLEDLRAGEESRSKGLEWGFGQVLWRAVSDSCPALPASFPSRF